MSPATRAESAAAQSRICRRPEPQASVQKPTQRKRWRGRQTSSRAPAARQKLEPQKLRSSDRQQGRPAAKVAREAPACHDARCDAQLCLSRCATDSRRARITSKDWVRAQRNKWRLNISISQHPRHLAPPLTPMHLHHRSNCPQTLLVPVRPST